MIRKLTLVAAFGAGYVLGAKAGKERYAQITAGARNLAAKPAVQSATVKAADLADTAKDKAVALAGDAVGTVKDKVGSGDDEVVDLTGATTRGSTTA